MTNEQILKKAIEKAVDNGWKGKSNKRHEKGFKNWDFWIRQGHYKSIIFSHDFAEAFAKYILKERSEMIPQSINSIGKQKMNDIKNWFLQQIVLEENPLKYIKKFLK